MSVVGQTGIGYSGGFGYTHTPGAYPQRGGVYFTPGARYAWRLLPEIDRERLSDIAKDVGTVVVVGYYAARLALLAGLVGVVIATRPAVSEAPDITRKIVDVGQDAWRYATRDMTDGWTYDPATMPLTGSTYAGRISRRRKQYELPY